jgi:hypothetical protein
MHKLESMQSKWAYALYALADTLCTGAGMGVPFFNIACGFVVGWIAAGRARAQTSDLRAALRLSLRYALLTSAWTLLLMLIIWGPFTLKLFDPRVDLAQTGIPLILYDPRASFIGWVVLMMLISPFLQLLTTVIAATLRLAR